MAQEVRVIATMDNIGFNSLTASPIIEQQIRSNWADRLNEVFPGRYNILGAPTLDINTKQVIYFVEDSHPYAQSLSAHGLGITDTDQDNATFLTASYRVALGQTKDQAQAQSMSAHALVIDPITIGLIIEGITALAILIGIGAAAYYVISNQAQENKIIDACISGKLNEQQCNEWKDWFGGSLSKQVKSVVVWLIVGAVALGGLLLAYQYFKSNPRTSSYPSTRTIEAKHST